MEIETLRPNGVVAGETNITYQAPSTGAHFDKVDDVEPDENTTTVSEVTDYYKRDIYHLQDHSVGSGTINSITIYFRIKPYSGRICYAKPVQKSGEIVTEGTEQSNNTTDYVTKSQTYTINPATDNPYTWEEIDVLDVGVALKSNVSGWNVYCTQVYVEVGYTIGVTHELAGVIAGVASGAGAVAVLKTLAGVATGVCSAVASLTVPKWLQGATAGVCSTAGALTVRGIKWMAGVSAGVASASGATSILKTLVGVSSGVCSAIADLTNIKWLLGATAGKASATATLGLLKLLAGVSAGAASATATLGIWKFLAGLSAGVATVTGDLFHVRRAIRVLAAVRNLLAVRNIPPVR